MEVEKIVDKNIPRVESDTRIGKVRSKFDKDLPKGVVVFRDGEYVGIMEQRKLMSSHVKDDTNVDRFVNAAPKLEEGIGVRKASRMMVDGSAKIAPYFNKSDELVGIVTQDSIVRAVKDNFDVISVDDICTHDVITVSEDATLGQVTAVIRQNGISRVPVENDGKLVGIITTHDIMEYSVRRNDSSTEGARGGERDNIRELPAKNAMSSPVKTISKDSTVKDAVEIMLETGYDGLVVDGENKDIGGIITKTDAVRSLTIEEDDTVPVQVTNVDLMDRLNRSTIRQEITDIVDKYQNLSVHYAHVRFHIESRATRRGQNLIRCTIRLRTNKREIAGSGEGYGSRNAFNVACDKLERNVLDLKGMNDPSNTDRDEMNQLFRF